MLYYSLNRQAPEVDFRTATLLGQAPDKGLYFPQNIPQLPKGFLNILDSLSKEEIACQVIQPYVGNTIPQKELENIVAQTVAFPFPLLPLSQNISVLELFHGPTLAFKDVGARFMSRCLGYFLRNNNKKVTVLVATSGDTGGAVAHGFYNVEGINVVILYPKGKVSDIQERQLTTLGNNITALQVEGNFDDCQQMVKQAFADKALQNKVPLTSANSINVARWLPQQFYYFFAYQQSKDKQHPPVICVPSGNFGNICAGLLAQQSGLPIPHFVAACNANAVVTQFLQSGNYNPQPAVATLSNAMDVGNPSNFIRIQQLFGGGLSYLKENISSYSISNNTTIETMQKVFEKFGYITDPHGAVAFAALQQYLAQHPGQKGIFLETAHPVKFVDVVEKAIGEKVALPTTVSDLMTKKKNAVPMSSKYEDLKDFLYQLQ